MQDTIGPRTRAEAALGSRAIGAMFFAAFGTAWLLLGAFRGLARWSLAVLPIAIAGAVLLSFAYKRYARYRRSMEVLEGTPEKRRIGRLFNFINAAQWVAIFIVANVLANIGLADWGIPAAIIIIGLHFLPLARLFENPGHYVTGAALVLIGAAYALLKPIDPVDALGCAGAGLVLWASALRALKTAPLPESP
ncbi:MAG: hypothetical protein ACREVL_02050 [Solimonas sp.]